MLVEEERTLKMVNITLFVFFCLELSQMAMTGELESAVCLASLETECGRQTLRWSQVILAFEYPCPCVTPSLKSLKHWWTR